MNTNMARTPLADRIRIDPFYWRIGRPKLEFSGIALADGEDANTYSICGIGAGSVGNSSSQQNNSRLGVANKTEMVSMQFMEEQIRRLQHEIIEIRRIAPASGILDRQSGERIQGPRTTLEIMPVREPEPAVDFNSKKITDTVRQSNIQLACYSYRRNCVKTRLRCSLLNYNYTLQVLQQVVNQQL